MALPAAVARAQDIDTCFAIADRVASGEQVTDFDIVGRPAEKPN